MISPARILKQKGKKAKKNIFETSHDITLIPQVHTIAGARRDEEASQGDGGGRCPGGDASQNREGDERRPRSAFPLLPPLPRHNFFP